MRLSGLKTALVETAAALRMNAITKSTAAIRASMGAELPHVPLFSHWMNRVAAASV
jgi:hypothetical protein